MAWTRVAALAEVPPGSLIEVETASQYVAVCNVDGEVRAMYGVCPHQGGPLGEGGLNGDTITCPWHMWEFDSRTGECVFSSAVKIPVYPVRVEDGEVLVDLA